ncbi:hypothetical protein IG631_09943 [Alternaria alternata]|nr:hypothetical protein IG631_09943 [Alternaria alternata]
MTLVSSDAVSFAADSLCQPPIVGKAGVVPRSWTNEANPSLNPALGRRQQDTTHNPDTST